MVIKTISQAYVGILLSIGGAPYLKAIVPMSRDYVFLMMKWGSAAIVKEYVTLTMRLVQQYFGANKTVLAKMASDAAFEILERAVKRNQKHKRGSKRILPRTAECIVVGLENIAMDEGPDRRRLKMLLDSAATLFGKRVGLSRMEDVKDMSRGWIMLLIMAIDPPGRE